MKLLVILLSMVFVPFASAGFSLSGQPEIKEEAYTAQLEILKEKVRNSLQVTGTLKVYEDELSIAPLVVKMDFQKLIKVAQGARVLGEYTPWLDFEQSIWGFEDVVDRADDYIAERLIETLGGEIYGLSEEVESLSSSLIYYPVDMPDLNRKMPNYERTFIALDSFGFSYEDIVEATRLELGEDEEMDGVVFFPYINVALHKQSATTSQMNGELMINYAMGINGYFALCIKAGCFTAQLPDDTYIDMIVPLVHRREATSDESHNEAREFGQELLGQMITEFTMVAFNKLAEQE